MLPPKRSLAEYFQAKGIDASTLPIVKTVDNAMVLHGGVTMYKTGGGTAIPKCTSLPFIAKRVNRALGKDIFGYKNFFNLSHQNMNGCEILFEEFGDIHLLWIVPNPVSMAEYLNDDMETIGVWSYYNHGIILTANTLPPEKDHDAPDMEEVRGFLDGLLTMIGEDFIYNILNTRNIIGCVGNYLYLRDKENRDKYMTLHLQLDDSVKANLMQSTAFINRTLDRYCGDSQPATV